MTKDKSAVLERLKAKIQPYNRVFVRKNLEISDQISDLLKEKGWTQKDLANRLGKSESEVSKLLSGLHNLTLQSLAKIEVVLESDVITTPKVACKKYSSIEYVKLTMYVPMPEKKTLQNTGYENAKSINNTTMNLNIA
jgi:transcriptional regulator with XRE-family HTH domain